MKKLILNVFAAALVAAITSCHDITSSNTSDSAEAVQEKPGKNANPTDTTAATKDSTAATGSKTADVDTKFTSEAGVGGMMEVELGKLAQSKAVAPEVVELANMMVLDHTKANNELKAIAAIKKIKVPTILDEKHRKDYEKLSKMARSEFDKAYTEYMVKDHKEDIDKFKAEAEKGKDAELKGFAGKHVPILQHHLQLAEKAKTVADAKK
jgi:putative membrane protein